MIYCDNTNCQNCIILEKPFLFCFGRLTVPFDDPVKGKCKCKSVELHNERFEDANFRIEQPVCKQNFGFCGQFNCANNSGQGECSRSDILVGESLISHRFICKCFSVKKLSGHVDWSKNLKPDGTSKGGNISDSEVNSYKRKKLF